MRALLAGLGQRNRRAVEEVLRTRNDSFLVTARPEEIARIGDPVQVAVVEGSDVGVARAFVDAIRAAPSCRECVILAMIDEHDGPKLRALLGAGVDDIYFVSLGPMMLAARLEIDERAASVRIARRTAEDQQERFFALSIDMLCIAGLDGYFRTVSPSWTTTLGWSADELCAAPWIDFVHPDDVPLCQGSCRMTLAA